MLPACRLAIYSLFLLPPDNFFLSFNNITSRHLKMRRKENKNESGVFGSRRTNRIHEQYRRNSCTDQKL